MRTKQETLPGTGVVCLVVVILVCGGLIFSFIGMIRSWNHELEYAAQMNSKPESQANRLLLKAAEVSDILEFDNGMVCIITDVTFYNDDGTTNTVALRCGKDEWEGGGMYDPWAFEFGVNRLSWYLKHLSKPGDADYSSMARRCKKSGGKNPAPRTPEDE